MEKTVPADQYSDLWTGQKVTHQYPPTTNEPALSLLLEYLDTDALPAFILDVKRSESISNLQHAEVHYLNPALKKIETIEEQIASRFKPLPDASQNDTSFQGLVDWLSGIGIGRSVAPGSLQSCGFRWVAKLLKHRWAVVTAIEHIKLETSTLNPRDGRLSSKPDLTGYEKLSHVTEDTAILLDEGFNRIPLGNVFPHGRLGDNIHLDWIRNFDWASTSCGPIHTWSSQLRQSCEMMLASPHPVALVWGDDHTILYNEAYIPLTGDIYRKVMGRPLKENWPEAVYETYVPLFDHVKMTGKALQQEDVAQHFCRGGYLEEDHFNLTFIPILADDASVAGMYAYVSDTTKQVLLERRMRTMINVNESLAKSTNMHELWEGLADVLKDRKSDIHFAAVFTRPSELGSPPTPSLITVEAVVGMNTDPIRLTQDCVADNRTDLTAVIDIAFNDSEHTVLSTKDGSLSEGLLARLTKYGLEESCREIVVQSLKPGIDENVTAVFMIGVNPLRPFDDDNQNFMQLLKKQIESALTVVKLVEKERALLQEKATAESEKRFMLFAERAPVGIFMYEKEGTMKFCNKAYETLSGISAKDLTKPMAWTDVMHIDSINEAKVYWQRLSNLEGPFTFEMQFKKPWKPMTSSGDDESLDRTWGLVSVYPDVSDNGELRGIYGCVMDVSYVKWAEKVQFQRLSEALELKRQQENFLDMTSHEMRNPLNAMSLCASELVEQFDHQFNMNELSIENKAALNDCLDMAKTITYCAKHQKRIIDDVLTLSKLDSKLLNIAPISADPLNLFKEVLNIFESELRISQIKADVHALEDYRNLCTEEVLIDSHRVSQVIINLMSNAIKFMKNGSRRHLRLTLDSSPTEPAQDTQNFHYVPSGLHRQDPTHKPAWGTGDALFLIFSFEDTGPGMTEEESSLLFNRFAQASPRTHAHFGGSGLGLFISRELAEMHGGRIGLSSQFGLGSTFRFYVKCRLICHSKDLSSENSTELDSSDSRRASKLTETSEGEVEREGHVRGQIEGAEMSDRKLKILIVEDNVINQKLLEKLILKHGYEASVANHGEEALAIIQSSAWGVNTDGPELDIILCDIEMPVMDGKTCVRRIRQMQKEGALQPNIPVVAVTGNARDEQIRAAKECGFDDVIAKPYETQEILTVLNSFLGKGHNRTN